jgi:hypothetical protein
MKFYITISKKSDSHFNGESAAEAIKRIFYTDKSGAEHKGAHWSVNEILKATEKLKFKSCVTDWDKYVAFNYAYADFNKIMSDEMIILAAFSFFFDDEDAPCDKVYRYVQSMSNNA